MGGKEASRGRAPPTHEEWILVPVQLKKMAGQGSGTLRQQLLMNHGIARYCMVLHGIAWFWMVLHGIAC